MDGSTAARRAYDTAETVTASTALTLPRDWGSLPVKSNVTSSPVTVTDTVTRAGRCCSGAAPVESNTSSARQVPSGSSASAARMRRSP